MADFLIGLGAFSFPEPSVSFGHVVGETGPQITRVALGTRMDAFLVLSKRKAGSGDEIAFFLKPTSSSKVRFKYPNWHFISLQFSFTGQVVTICQVFKKLPGVDRLRHFHRQ